MLLSAEHFKQTKPTHTSNAETPSIRSIPVRFTVSRLGTLVFLFDCAHFRKMSNSSGLKVQLEAFVWEALPVGADLRVRPLERHE